MYQADPLRRRCLLAGLTLSALSFSSGVLAQQAAASNAIGVGIVRPLSGPLMAVAAGYLESVRAVFAAVNAEGGVGGRKLELIERDDQGRPDQTAAQVKALAANPSVVALIGVAGTDNVLSASPFLQEGRLPLIGPFSGSAALRDAQHRLIFHVRANYDDEVNAILETMVMRHPSGKVAVLYQDDAFGAGTYGALLRAVSARAPQLKVSAHKFERSSGTLAEGAAAMESVKIADAVLLLGAPKAVAKLLSGVRGQNRVATVYTLSVVDALGLVKDAGTATAAGVVVPQVFPNPRKSALKLVSDYRALMEKTGQPLSYAGLEGYVAARVLVEGLKRVRGGPVSREKLVASLEGLGRLDLDGFAISYSASSRAGSRFVDLSMISTSGSVID